LDILLRYSQHLLKPIVSGLRRGDPEVVAPLYHLIDHVDPRARKPAFLALQKRLQTTQDEALAAQLNNGGLQAVAREFPVLAIAIAQYADRLVDGAARELEERGIGTSSALSPRAQVIRRALIRVPLRAIIAAKVRRWVQEAGAIGSDAGAVFREWFEPLASRLPSGRRQNRNRRARP
jgi:hypothetical protein